VSGVAVGTVADALSAIRTHVFEQRTVAMPALVPSGQIPGEVHADRMPVPHCHRQVARRRKETS
jgi:hypothetical protein